MSGSRRLTAIIEREGDGYAALRPELDVASEGDSVELARPPRRIGAAGDPQRLPMIALRT